MAIPRYREHTGPVLFSAGFRPFFLGASAWAAIAVPLWLAAYGGNAAVPTALSPIVWHAHEMIYGFAAAAVAGFMLTAIPNWTGRMPLQGWPLALLVALWAVGRVAMLVSANIGEPIAAAADLSFPALFLAVVGREILAGKNWRNAPMILALAFLLAGNLLVHLEALGIAETAQAGNRLGLFTVLMLISLIGGRIIPSFTRNWLARMRPEISPPPPEGIPDRAALLLTAIALILWVAVPASAVSSAATTIAGIAILIRLSRWQGIYAIREPLLLVLHAGYLWLALGLLLIGVDGFYEILPRPAALHALTVGAIGTMTVAVMTRASLGHTGRPLEAGWGTKLIYLLITIAAVLRVLSPLAGENTQIALSLAGTAWSGAYGLYFILYGRVLMKPRVQGEPARPIQR